MKSSGARPGAVVASSGRTSTCCTRATIARAVAQVPECANPVGSLAAMPTRRTKRGVERTPLDGEWDVVVCGASFAGLAVARELAGVRCGSRPARVLVLDRYEVGERQTSACAAPTDWLTALGLERSLRQTFDTLVIHTPRTTARFRLPWTFSTFDYPQLCAQLDAQNDAAFDIAT